MGGRDGQHEGNVMVGTGSLARPVCDDSWDLQDGAVVCRQLGYHGVLRITKAASKNIHGQAFC